MELPKFFPLLDGYSYRYSLHLPRPASVNRYLRARGSRVYLNQNYKRSRDHIALLTIKQVSEHNYPKLLGKRLALVVLLRGRGLARLDVDNALKCLIDGLKVSRQLMRDDKDVDGVLVMKDSELGEESAEVHVYAK